ncbi:LOW QUALITY PROTEIN: uncharacterized protein LOC109823693 [Asparagus officinalis]|uniref:LOW QUALITY PROTEIN: uncharacterized protein LOC109823693 n=1 Tax=Asparagus officinalis TaxID=4686 RepID=UPI00098E4E01|nr:LOW QUALITY PROTEIN: uncharacterized protein LOC109823693 [Asparagus officinalis]
MGEEGGESAAAHARRPAMRIFLRDVGPTISSGDIERTFSSLVRVSGVEIVRSRPSGRSFAYMDLEPTSDITLAKLFSTYNGCTWKGGKLKLEKAKEHYLDRLKREWAEDAKLKAETPTDSDTDKDAGNSKPDRFEMENMQLRIFFPKLRKVKSLPFKGTGKHKYSFQRIEVPALPIHFCDCEEHNESSRTASKKYLSALNSGVHYEKELDIMNSVMNKLLKKESNEPNTEEETVLSAPENLSRTSIDDIHEEESEEESEVDDDELVTNIWRGRSGKRKVTLNQESSVSKHQSFKNESNHNKANTLKRKKGGPVDASEVTANKKAHLESPVKIIENEFSAILPRKKSSDVDIVENEFSAILPRKKTADVEIIENEFSAILSQKKTSEVQSQESNTSTEPSLDKDLTEPSEIVTQSTKGQSWLQKSSWKNLVAGNGNSSFNIHHTQEPEIPVEPQTDKGQKERSKLGTQSTSQKEQSKLATQSTSQKEQSKLAAQSTKGQTGKSPFGINDSQETEISAEPQTEISAEPQTGNGQNEQSKLATQSARGQSWLQKNSWKDLVGGTTDSSFSITNVLPGISSLIQKQPKNSDSAIDTSIEVNENKSEKRSKLLPAVDEMVGNGDKQEANAGQEEHKGPQQGSEQKSRSTVSDVCTFMRSDESLRQWAEAKTALSRYLNKKKKKKKKDEDESPKRGRKMR